MSVEVQTPFGEWLRARRKALDLTQFDLAERIGCAESTIQRIEAGERRPSKQVAVLLAEALAVPAADQAAFVRFARAATPAGPPRAAAPAPPAPRPPLALPVPLTALLGREVEVQAAQALLGGPQGRLLTLTGPPGVGKTRLALALAAALAPGFPDGACFVPLAPLRDPALVADSVAQALGLQDSAGGPPGARLAAYLRNQRLLLVLDNFEQVVAAAPQVGTWLSAAPGVRILATSRVALGLRGERRFPVAPLAVPPPDTPAPPHVLLAYPSVALFVERAQAVDPTFHLTPDNAPAVAALCAWLEGVPLAIELAAARSARLSPNAVRARLPRRLDLSAGGLRDLPPHQQTMRAALAWSYDLLGCDEQQLFRRLAVFAGGATLEAVEAVCNAHCDLVGGAQTALEGLLDASLAQQEQGPDGSLRISLLEMVREYAQEQLATQAEAEPLARLYAEYYLSLAERAADGLYGPEQVAWLNHLEAEHNNVRAVLTWAADRGAQEVSLRLAGALGRFWQGHGYWTEGRAWLTAALAGAGGPARARGRALIHLGRLALLQGDRPALRQAAEAALPLAQEVGDARLTAESLCLLAKAAGYDGDSARQAALLDQGLALCVQAGDRWGQGLILYELGYVAWMHRDWPVAQARTEESLALYRAVGDPRQIAAALVNLGGIQHGQRRFAPARAYYLESLPLMQASGELWGLAGLLSNLGLVAAAQHDYPAAAEFYQQSLRLRRRLGNLVELGRLLNNMGDLARAAEDLPEARRCFEEALAVFAEAGYPDRTEFARVGLALVALGEEAVAEAEAHGRLALADPTNRNAVTAFGPLAGVAARRGQGARGAWRAARLLGAFGALSREADGDQIFLVEDFFPEGLVEEIQAQLGAAEFAAAWAEGQALGWDAARDYALAG